MQGGAQGSQGSVATSSPSLPSTGKSDWREGEMSRGWGKRCPPPPPLILLGTVTPAPPREEVQTQRITRKQTGDQLPDWDSPKAVLETLCLPSMCGESGGSEPLCGVVYRAGSIFRGKEWDGCRSWGKGTLLGGGLLHIFFLVIHEILKERDTRKHQF